MNATTDFERSLAAWLERAGPDAVPERVVEAALAEARTVRQRPAWLTSSWWASLVFRASREGEAMRPSRTIERVPTIPVIRPPLRLGWIAVAGAALLALLGGLLAAGALQNREAPLLSECPAGTTPNEPGPVDQERPPQEISRAVWDGNRGLIVVADDWTWRFDVCTNTWSKFRTEGSGAFGALVYDADSGLVVSLDPYVWTFDPADGRSEFVGNTSSWLHRALVAAYDPVTGLVVASDLGYSPRTVATDTHSSLWTYDVDTDTWAEIDQGEPAPPRDGYGSLMEFDRSADRLVVWQQPQGYFTGVGAGGLQPADTWEFDLRARRWTQVSVRAPVVEFGWFGANSDAIVYDDANERTIVFADGLVAAYDAAADEWEIAFQDESTDGLGYGRYSRLALGYDPLNDRLVVVGGTRRTADPSTGEFLGWAAMDDVVAFDLRTRTWTELLAPSN